MVQRSLQGLIEGHNRPEAKVSLGPLAAIVVVSASQRHPHGGEGGGDGENGAEQPAEELERHGQEVDQPIGEVATGCQVAQTGQHT